MDKAEIRDEIIEAVNYFELHRSVSEDELNGLIDKKLEQYATEVSREIAIKREMCIRGYGDSKFFRKQTEDLFDEWKSNQEDKC